MDRAKRDPRQWSGPPKSTGERPVRIIAYRFDGRDEIYRLATTVLDPEQAPAEELGCAVSRTMEIETTYDEIKTHLLGPGAILRSKNPGTCLPGNRRPDVGPLRGSTADHEAAGTAREDPEPTILRTCHTGHAAAGSYNPAVSPPRASDGSSDP